METNRRTFIGHVGTAIAAILAFGFTTVGMSGCNVFTEIENWTSVGLSAVTSILNILGANGVLVPPAVTTALTLIKGLLADLKAAVTQYQATTPPPAGLLAKIETIFQDIVDNFSSALTGLGLSGSLFSAIASIVQVILSTIAGFVNQLPAPVGGARTFTVGTTFKIGSTVIPVVPKARSPHGFRKDFDANLHAAAHAGVNIPKSAYLEHWYDHTF